MATIDERNARLDALNTAVQDYATTQLAELNRRVSVNTTILQGRTGSARLAQSAVQQSVTLVVKNINDFLTG